MAHIKRIIDFLIAIIGLTLLSPLFLVVYAAVKLEDRGPVFFRQKRIGRYGNPFLIYKFRSMVVDTESKGAGVFVEKDDPRITRVGKFLRHTSLDEIPQLINVLKGEMSIIGPRPTLSYQVENYDQRQRRRLSVRPGITGWAQVNGRSSLTWPERIEHDLWYIDHWSLNLDLRILLRTIKVIFSREGLYKNSGPDPISGNLKDPGSEAGKE